MVAALHLSGSERVLEVGTGLGYETAILAQLCTHVYSIERFADLTESARERLQRAGIRNATLFVGDGSKGIAAHAPFDAIIVAAAAPTVSPALVEQLREGGSLVQPIGPGGDEMVTAFRKRGGRLTKEGDVIAAYFVPLVRDVGAD
jgi:protein-L-isoaspartate(D-aspartate) O-methyltransferase